MDNETLNALRDTEIVNDVKAAKDLRNQHMSELASTITAKFRLWIHASR